jgi:y4mF family transcriptional regulator
MRSIRIYRPEDIGALLKSYRRDRSLAQTDLAKKLGVSQRWISHAENGKPTLQLGLVLRVLNELGVELTAGAAAKSDKPRRVRRARVTSIDNIVDD